MTTILLTPKRRYACPHCDKAKSSLLCWRIGAIIGWALLFGLITYCK